MIARMRHQPIEAALALLAVVLVALALVAVVQERGSSGDRADEKRRLEATLEEAASHDLAALTAERDALATSGESAFPTRSQAESRIAVVTRLINESGLVLGPVKQGELSAIVANSDIGLSGDVPAPRTYPAIEWTLEARGLTLGMLAFVDELLTEVPGATFHDLIITQDPVTRSSRLSVRIVFYHQPG